MLLAKYSKGIRIGCRRYERSDAFTSFVDSGLTPVDNFRIDCVFEKLIKVTQTQQLRNRSAKFGMAIQKVADVTAT